MLYKQCIYYIHINNYKLVRKIVFNCYRYGGWKEGFNQRKLFVENYDPMQKKDVFCKGKEIRFQTTFNFTTESWQNGTTLYKRSKLKQLLGHSFLYLLNNAFLIINYQNVYKNSWRQDLFLHKSYIFAWKSSRTRVNYDVQKYAYKT